MRVRRLVRSRSRQDRPRGRSPILTTRYVAPAIFYRAIRRRSDDSFCHLVRWSWRKNRQIATIMGSSATIDGFGECASFGAVDGQGRTELDKIGSEGHIPSDGDARSNQGSGANIGRITQLNRCGLEKSRSSGTCRTIRCRYAHYACVMRQSCRETLVHDALQGWESAINRGFG